MNRSQRRLLETIRNELGSCQVDIDEDLREGGNPDYDRGQYNMADFVQRCVLDEHALDAVMKANNRYKWQFRWFFVRAWLFHPVRTYKLMRWEAESAKKTEK